MPRRSGLMTLTELTRANLDTVGALSNPADHLSGVEPGLGAVGAQGPRPQHPYGIPQPELVRF